MQRIPRSGRKQGLAALPAHPAAPAGSDLWLPATSTTALPGRMQSTRLRGAGWGSVRNTHKQQHTYDMATAQNW